MLNERRPGAILRFHDVSFAPGAQVIKAHERERWVELEQLRKEADARIEQEVLQATIAARQALEERAVDVMAQAAISLGDAFARAAAELERTALDLAFQIASRVIDTSPPEAFFARAAEHLQTLVPHGSAVCIRVHPEAAGALGPFSERLRAMGVRHLNVVTDPTLSNPRSLMVETGEGDIDLGCGTQLRRIAAEVARGQPAGNEGDGA
jgi:flagellar biosynthesis/type III secretory pathway protein FliH